jgi:PAS domain S-box-containing protein
MEELVRAGSMLSRQQNFMDLVRVFVEQTQDISGSSLAAFYVYQDDNGEKLKLMFRRGNYYIPDALSGNTGLIQFIKDCRETVIFNNLKNYTTTPDFLRELLLHRDMQSGAACPVHTPKRNIGVLFVNSREAGFYRRDRFYFLNSFSKLAAGSMETSRLFQEMREQFRKIEALERYQESIFDSMTNMIVTTDPSGNIHYFNKAAAEALSLGEQDLEENFQAVFKKSLGSRILGAINRCIEDGENLIGLEGIYKKEGNEIDYSLNISPINTPRGRAEGLTLLFTNQTKEKEFREQAKTAVEERRRIKDMFARYLSADVVSSLVDYPDSIKMGGAKKDATVFFADIRGYTSFSHGKDPETIIEILNEYFGEAVDRVISHRGYIDKFIGDCIMAVWGVPLSSGESDVINAVSCALTIQDLVRSPKRNFFRREASKLKIGIGINTGPLVAGNLGSTQRMDYSVIGDTVNVASRLEGLAQADEIIISQTTRDSLGNAFRLEKKPAVKIKGKTEPVQIYRVLGRA